MNRWLRAIAIVMIAWSARAVFDYGTLALRLGGRTPVERGALASDEWNDVLARAGRPRMRQAYAAARSDGSLAGRRSSVAEAWRWIVAAEPELPPDARIYLDLPSDLYYYYGTTFWYPRRLEVGAKAATIANGDALRAAAVHVEPRDLAALREAGFTHLVARVQGEMRLIDLREPPPGAAR